MEFEKLMCVMDSLIPSAWEMRKGKLFSNEWLGILDNSER